MELPNVLNTAAANYLIRHANRRVCSPMNWTRDTPTARRHGTRSVDFGKRFRVANGPANIAEQGSQGRLTSNEVREKGCS